jgi:beta-galactosidase
MLAAPVTPTVWRAPTDNDRRIRHQWEALELDKLECYCKGVSVSEEDGCVRVTSDVILSAKAMKPALRMKIDYYFSEGCPVRIGCEAEVDESLPMLPRFGFKFVLPHGFENVKYFGYGPMESYQDKRLASRLSVFDTTATQNFEHYIRPQENSAHFGTRWAYVSAPYGHGLFFGAKEFSFSVSHFSPEYLTKAAHDYELVPEKETTVIIDYRNAGIGSNSCGPALRHPYRIEEKKISFDFSFSPEFAGRINYFDEWSHCIK